MEPQPSPHATQEPARLRYPLQTVLIALVLVAGILIVGSTIIDARWDDYQIDANPAYTAFRGTCYWIGDSRTLERIALFGYTDYRHDLSGRFLADYPDRSWWPMFPLLTSLMITLSGDGACSNWNVNLVAVLLLVALLPLLLRTRRLAPLVGLMAVPYAMSLYVGIAEGLFLFASGALWLVCLQSQPDRRRRNFLAGAGALLIGIIAGLTKPNSMTLMPAFFVMWLVQSLTYQRAADPGDWRSRLRRVFSDGNPGWAALLAAVGIALGNGIWFYQTSGYYPFYVLLAQRSFWYKQFHAGDLFAMFDHFSLGLEEFLAGAVEREGLASLVRLSALPLVGALALQALPPRRAEENTVQPPAPPLYARVGLLSILVVMFLTGQAHAITRYTMDNIFFVVLYLRYVYGTDDEPPVWQLPLIVLRRKPGTLRAALRLTLFLLGPILTWIIIVGQTLRI